MAVTPGQATVAAGADRVRTVPPQAVPPIELPAGPDQLARDAAVQLGWDGYVLPQLTLLGRRVFVVAALRAEIHAERIAIGVGPVTDRATVATWMWPELTPIAPPAAVRITGVLAVARHWRTGMAAIVPFARYGEAALVLPSSIALSHDYVDNCLPRVRSYGMGVVIADNDANTCLDLATRFGRFTFGEDAISRWINEMAYEQLLAAEVPVRAE